MTDPTLAIVVVNYGSSELLALNLTSVEEAIPDAVVIVVDSFSGDEERRRVSALAEERAWRSVLLDENLGFGGGVNRGVALALENGCEDFLILNPDASIDALSVERLRARLRDDRLAIAAPIVRTPAGVAWFAGADVSLEDGTMRSWARRAEVPLVDAEPWLSGACLLATAEVWDAVGGFNESYFLYWEDVDLSHRVLAAGGSLHLVRDAVAVHDEGGTQEASTGGGRAKSEGYYYYNIRNRLLFASLHLDEAGMRRWHSTSRRAAREVLFRGGRRQFLRPLRPIRAALRGLRDGRGFVRAALETNHPDVPL